MNKSPQEADDMNPDRLPPIGIKDLIILTTSMAIVFTFYENVTKAGWFYPSNNTLFNLVTRFSGAILMGIPLTSVYWLVKQKRTTGRFFQQPGHWILAGIAIVQIAILSSVFSWKNAQDVSSHNVIFFYYSLSAAYFFSSIVFVIAAAKNGWRWCGVLSLLSLMSFVVASQSIVVATMVTGVGSDPFDLMAWFGRLQFAARVTAILCCVVLLATVVTDLIRKTPRDWLHWAGVLVSVFFVAIQPVIDWAYSYFKFYPAFD